MKRRLKRVLRRILPLRLRRALAAALCRLPWPAGARRGRWAAELVRDLKQRDAAAYHKFLWAHHLEYAAPYETALRFGAEHMRGSRRLLFDDLLRELGDRAVASVLEVGCSCGYQLRHAEEIFPDATEFLGFDLDGHAIAAGRSHLARLGSRVRLEVADMEELAARLAGRTFDVVLCTGVLMYLPTPRAAAVVATLLRHTRRLLALSGPADEARDNRERAGSSARRDGSLVHNLDAMVEAARGRVVARRWEGARRLDGQTVYFVFAAPGRVRAGVDG